MHEIANAYARESTSRTLSVWRKLADQAAALFVMGEKLPQEHIGSEFLERVSAEAFAFES